MENDHHPTPPAKVQAYLSVLEAIRQDLNESDRNDPTAAKTVASAKARLQLARIYNRLELSVLEGLVDQTPVRRLDRSRAALEQRAIEAILSGTEWLTGDEVGEQYNPASKNKHAVVSRWLSEGKVYAIERRSQRLFARYQFDEAWRPLPAIAEILRNFSEYTPFRIAGWFESSSAFLDGRRPREVIRTDPNLVIKAARDHLAGPLHG